MEILPKWKDHPLTRSGLVELVPTDWVFDLRGTDVIPETGLKDGTRVDMESLWENIKHEGLHDPMIIRVGIKNKKFRLEAGNHRIQVFKKYGVPYTPTTVQVQDFCGQQAEDVMTIATHNFDFTADIDISNLKFGYTKPSTVFKSLSGKVLPS